MEEEHLGVVPTRSETLSRGNVVAAGFVGVLLAADFNSINPKISMPDELDKSLECQGASLLEGGKAQSYATGQSTAAGMGEDAKPYPHQPQLLVYYASQGERLWDIAKSHRALLSDLREQNDLPDDVLPEARPLIICNR